MSTHKYVYSSHSTKGKRHLPRNPSSPHQPSRDGKLGLPGQLAGGPARIQHVSLVALCLLCLGFSWLSCHRGKEGLVKSELLAARHGTQPWTVAVGSAESPRRSRPRRTREGDFLWRGGVCSGQAEVIVNFSTT